ncbi:MAG: hypothetical protein J6Z27_03585, partial [Bacteroidales bacterium]|nr:hypothetical protein [Bacteroidales bacterium]
HQTGADPQLDCGFILREDLYPPVRAVKHSSLEILRKKEVARFADMQIRLGSTLKSAFKLLNIRVLHKRGG